jgi:plasmid stabilization system protein ParE
VNRPIIVKPEAEADLAEARDWYEGRQAGMGETFLAAVDGAFAGVQQTPELFPRAFRDVRLARVKRFPFVVLYRIDDDQITVVAVYHTSRDPRGWRGRV